ncbi:uncharacterized protein G2W53_028787 [Senna tora]|uniref:Uncharacterized protein n=1 Tax=Senna tora TaxID=362788 RepID=A0A834WB27_9FABA|nr:uncharacterized protein G2W53_028787 [Senna tora]
MDKMITKISSINHLSSTPVRFRRSSNDALVVVGSERKKDGMES